MTQISPEELEKIRVQAEHYARRLMEDWEASQAAHIRPQDRGAASRDFFMAAATVIIGKCRGVRMAFGACFVCGSRMPGRYRRVFLADEKILVATDKRIFFGELCEECDQKHLAGIRIANPTIIDPTEQAGLVEAALKWISEVPPEAST